MKNMTFTLTDLTLEEVNAILMSLQELPAKICNPLTLKIKTQAEQQLPQPDQSGEGA